MSSAAETDRLRRENAMLHAEVQRVTRVNELLKEREQQLVSRLVQTACHLEAMAAGMKPKS